MNKFIFYICFFVSIGSLKAQLMVDVLIDSPFTLSAWSDQLAGTSAIVTNTGSIATEAVTIASNTTRIAHATELLIQYVGDPMSATARLDNVSAVVRRVGGMTDNTKKLDTFAKSSEPAAAMASSSNSFRAEVGVKMNIYDKEESRDIALYSDELKMENAVNGARRMMDQNRKNLDVLTGKITDANEELEQATTISQILAAQADIARINAMINSTSAAAQNLAVDYELKRAQREIADSNLRTRRTEEVVARSRMAAAKQEAQRRSFNKNVQSALSSTPAASWDTSIMFNRTLTPVSP
jgi:hypothetical protein